MDNSAHHHKIEQYIRGLMTEEERKAFEKELAQDPDLQKELDVELLLFEGIAQIERERIQQELSAALDHWEHSKEVPITNTSSVPEEHAFHLPVHFPVVTEGIGGWLARSFSHFKSGLVFGITPTFALATGLLLLAGIQPQFAWLNAYSIQLLVIGLATFWLYVICPSPNYYLEANRASLGLSQFWKWWRLIWVMWLFLYLFLSLRDANVLMNMPVLSELSSGHPFFNILIHLANNLASLAIFICYDIIQKDTFRSKKKQGQAAAQGISNIKVLMPDVKDVFFDAEEIIGSNINKNKYYLLLLTFTLVEVFFLFTGWYNGDAIKIFGLLSGMIGGIAFGMLFSKLNSKYLGLNEFFFILLITYIVIQPGFNFLTLSFGFENAATEKILMNVFAYMALILKLVLLAIIQWLVFSNQLLYYLAVSAHLNKEVEDHRIQAIKNISDAKPIKYKELWKVRKA